MKHKSIYFCGNKISDYGIQNKRLDYGTLSKAFDAVLVNDITKLFYSSVNGEYIEPEQIHGFIDYSEEIEELQKEIEKKEEAREENEDPAIDLELAEQINVIEQDIEYYQYEMERQPEIYQYFIVTENGAEIIQRYTNDPLYYIDFLGCYVWGVTHFGTSWYYVLTDTVLEIEEN